MKELTLSKGKVAIVDDNDYEHLRQWKWSYAQVNPGKGYAMRHDGDRRTVYLHRYLTQCPKGLEVDHVSGDTLDNTRKNLRICTISDNRKNQRRHRDKSTPYKGVYWDKKRRRWIVFITANGRRISLGRFSNPLIASMCYSFAAKYLHGEFARTNCV